MENIYQRAVRAVSEGAKFAVNFQKRSCRINGQYLINNGQYDGELGVEQCGLEQCLSQIETLYARYKHSVPSERSESKSKRYFKSLPEGEIEDDAMLYGERRDIAQIELELYVLCQILNGFTWNAETMGTWFWQSKNDKDLIILRNWIEPTNH